MSARSLVLLAALALGPAVLPRPAVAAPVEDAVAASERELDAGLAAYAEGDFTTAIEHFERAHALHPSPDYLYAWAQAARSAGDCATAIELYRRFIATGPTGASLEAARQNEARCAEQLAAEPEITAVPPPPTEPQPPPPSPPHDEPAPERPRARPDAVGLSLVVTGGAALGAGSVLLGLASARVATQERQTSYQRFDELDREIDRLHVAGGITLGVGAALAVAGAIRLGLRARHARRSPRHAMLVPGLDAHGTPMIVLRITDLR